MLTRLFRFRRERREKSKLTYILTCFFLLKSIFLDVSRIQLKRRKWVANQSTPKSSAVRKQKEQWEIESRRQAEPEESDVKEMSFYFELFTQKETLNKSNLLQVTL